LTFFKSALLILTCAAFHCFAAPTAAAPVVLGYGHFIDRFGPHSLPLLPVGDKVQIGAFLGSGDPIGSPTISVQVKQNGTTLTLNSLAPGHPLYERDYLFYKFIDFDPGLAGAWEIIPTDSTGTGPSIFTNAIPQPEFLPYVENVTVQGAPLGAEVSWTLPNLAGFDADAVGVRIIEATSGHHVFQSDLVSLQTTNYELPADVLGDLQIGVDYVYWVNLVDIDFDSYIENSSKVFSEPFRFTNAGDFNRDGAVDAADYAVWRKNFSGDQTMYDAWRTNFGSSLGTGSGSAGYGRRDSGPGASAEPLSAAVPEPTAIMLAAMWAALLLMRARAAPTGFASGSQE
jgi:hypothetical protein